MELSADINRVLQSSYPQTQSYQGRTTGSNSTQGGKTRIVLNADKDIAMAAMDRKEYIDKTTNLLSQAAYGAIDRDPNNKIKA